MIVQADVSSRIQLQRQQTYYGLLLCFITIYTPKSAIRLVLSLLSTSQQTGSSSSNQTSLLTWNSTSRDGRGLTNMLMVTTTVRVINWVHGHTSSSRPRVSLDLVLVESSTSLQQWLVDSTTTSNDTNDTSGVRGDDLLGTRWQLDSGLTFIWVVSNNDNVVTGGSTQSTSVTNLLFDVRDNGTFWTRAQWQNVTDVQRSLLTTVDKLASVNTFVGNEDFLSQLVSVWVSEGNLGQWSTSTWVVDNSLDDTTDVAVTFGIVQGSQLGSTLSQSGVRSEDGAGTLSLVTNHST
ncbi:putative 60S ribosomal protein [Clavispora lusitaniae]|nr:putative 60S ribosomal protein [Clavispora lusitaniae]